MTLTDFANYVVMHRDCPVEEKDMYRALCVGGFRRPDLLSEEAGKNIAVYNDRINELTGLYWIWKNTKEKYVGMSHYRRFFTDGGKRLDAGKAKDILCRQGYDIILAPITLGWSIRHNIEMCVDLSFAAAAGKVFLEEIRNRQPDYADAFVEVMKGNSMYYCNMLMARRDVLDAYCKWLFSFITYAADRISIEGADVYQRRTAGYYGETMMSVWMKRQDLKVYEMPLEVIR